MNVSYRIVKVDPYEHGILVRYFTDKVTENDLATSFNPDGSIKLHADGYPLSTRTDVFMSIFDVPPPNFDDLDKTIRTCIDGTHDASKISLKIHVINNHTNFHLADDLSKIVHVYHNIV